MRRYFLVGIVGVVDGAREPLEMAEFIDWEASSQVEGAIVRIRYCPFCGSDVSGEELRIPA